MRTAILECSFDPEKEISVLPAFQFLRITLGGERTRYIYERFTGRKSFEEALEDLSRRQGSKNISCLYISAHGNETHVGRVNEGQGINVNHIIKSVNSHIPSVDGIYIGSCHFSSDKNLRKIIDGVPNLRWVAGYDGHVDYSDGLALDLIYFRGLLSQSSIDEAAKAEKAARQTKKYCEGLVSAYGWDVLWRNHSEVRCLSKS